LMVVDTVYLPATIIRPRPTAEQFARDFAKTKVPDDDIEIARQNTSATKRRVLMRTVPGDGGEASKIQFNKIATRAVYQGQTPPMNIFNPAAWGEFIQAWKRGDFKNKN
ncbi:MAG: carboxypeptidase-like regulatory domain-containing protein, partial [Chitinophagaceae bacterium]